MKRRNDRRILYLWQRCDNEGSTAVVKCDDCPGVWTQLNTHAPHRVPYDATVKTTPPEVSRRLATAERCSNPGSLNDSGIAVEDHQHATAKSRCLFRRKKTPSTSTIDARRHELSASGAILPEVDETITRSHRCSTVATHPGQCRRRRRVHGSELRSVELFGDVCACRSTNQATLGGGTSLMIRVPRGGHMTIVIDNELHS